MVSTLRQIEIEIEIVLSVETNFWKPSRFSRRSRSTFILSRSRFLKSRLFSRDKDVSRFLSRSSRLIETFETNRDKTRFFEIFVNNRDFVEINRDFVEINRDLLSLDRDFHNVSRLFLYFFGPLRYLKFFTHFIGIFNYFVMQFENKKSWEVDEKIITFVLYSKSIILFS